jgi:hypothetical protein
MNEGMTRELTYDQYKSTLIHKMENVTKTATPVLDIWPYVQQLVNQKVVLPYVFENNLVEIVYRNGDNSFLHVLLPTDNTNTFIVIIIDLKKIEIKGHYRLELEMEYGSKST